MKMIIICMVIAFNCMAKGPAYIKKADKSETKNIQVKLDKQSDAKRYSYYMLRTVVLRAYASNNNKESTPITLDWYLIGKNSKGIYKLLKKQSFSSTLTAQARKKQMASVIYTYYDYFEGSRSKREYEYRGCVAIVKGADGKIITLEGEYDNFFTFIEGMSVGNTFNSKGAARVDRYAAARR